MKIRTDFVTNSSSSSFVMVNIEDKELARICKQYGIKLRVNGDKISCHYDLGEGELPISPRGTDFIKWFLNFINSLQLANKDACDEIEKHRKEIEDSFIKSEIIYEYNCSEDTYSNYHWEETRDKEQTVLKGFDAAKWERVWETEEWSEIAKLDDGDESSISRLSPSQYPFWLFLSEGWAQPDSGDTFVRNMMDKYGTRVFGKVNVNNEDDPRNEKIQKLIDELDKMSVDPAMTDLSMKSVAMNPYKIDGTGVYSYKSDRFTHIDSSFLDSVDQEYAYAEISTKYVEGEKNRRWAEYLRKLYFKALDEIGAIHLGNLSSRCDYVVLYRTIDGAADKFNFGQFIGEKYNIWDDEISHLTETEIESAKIDYYIHYLQNNLSDIKNANDNRGSDKEPVKVIWEDLLHNYLMLHTSLGNVEPKPVVGPNGTVRRTIPEHHERTMDYVITEMIARWPSRVINPKTKTYEKIVKEIEKCNIDIGYASVEEFFDAYGFSVKRDEVRSDTTKTENFEYTKTQKNNEVTLVKYIGSESIVTIPESIEGGVVKILGPDVFTSNNTVEEITVPDTVETIRGKAFAFCRNLKKVRLSNNVSKLVAGTFDGCEKLEEINIPDNVQELLPKFLIDCPLKRIHIGKSLKDVERFMFYQGESQENGDWNGLFEKTSAIESIAIDPENKYLKAIETMILTHDGKVLLAMLGDDDCCMIPEGVEIIADNAFRNQSRLLEVGFPSTLKYIGNYAFSFTGINSAEFPSSVKIIGKCAFYCCRNLEVVMFSEGIEEIYSRAFSVTNIKELVLPSSLTRLGDYSFDSHNIVTVEPEEWLNVINNWWSSSSEEKKFNTKELVDRVRKSSRKEAADSQLKQNIIGMGILSAMIAYLQSEEANKMELTNRLWLERMVISQEMQTALGINLKTVLSFYKKDSTEQLIECINAVKEIDDINLIRDYYERIKEVLSKNGAEAEVLIEGVSKIVGKEA